ncbi:hypothetical protein [Desulfopila sp. IMCC35008]|uniref:hypothetical protein n=1 Tax=Desulfopila sp. IMCC35008 TaxID=2653858 RepID=UPI0013D417AC|nr:hypothetical protein [Desulfopila sp. IMCC35008]
MPINTYTEYMDTKRHTDKRFLNAVLNLLKHKYEQRRLDLIITSDDNAYNMVRTLKDTLFPDTPVVFCGVNYLQNPQQFRGGNMTGVIES